MAVLAEREALAERARAFWKEAGRVSRLRVGVQTILTRTHTSVDAFRTVIIPKSGYKPFQSVTFERFFEAEGDLGGFKPRERLSVLLLCARDLGRKVLSDDAASFEDFAKLLWEHDAAFSWSELGTLLAPARTASPQRRAPRAFSGVEYSSFLDIFARLLQVSKSSFEDVARVFFEDWTGDLPEAPQQNRYICYRFDHVPQMVVKSYLVISSPFVGEEFCGFTNYFVAEGVKKPRQTSGLIIPMRDGLYFLGRIQQGEGLKVMVLPPVPFGHQTRQFGGLMLSLDEDSIPVASRILIVPTDAPNHEVAQCGRKPLASVRTEIEAFTEVGVIRNRIEFTLEGDVKCAGRRLDQTEMRDETARRIASYGDGGFTINGEPFNPADHQHYTFNSALRMARRV